MPRIIVTSRYLKSGSNKKLSNYMKYIATREGSVAVQLNSQNAPVTQKQQALILSLLTDFPESKESQTYADYTAHPTQQSASALISEIVEHNADRVITKEKYVSYLATRPGAVKSGQHGLFSQTDAPIDLNAVAKEIANHTGNVWTHVVSLRRDDAQRMGYDNLTAWRNLVIRQMPNIAKQMKIDLAHLRWYAAFHDKETNPHVHIVVYSTDSKEGFLTEQGIEKIRSGFANDIYSDELHHLYAQQTDVRDRLKTLSADRMQTLAAQITGGQPLDTELLRLVLLLSRQLSNAKGKKQYGYLKPEVKRTVDAIFSRLAADDTIRQMYSLWCEMEQAKHDVYSSAKVQFPELADNPQFKSVKNMIVKTVASMQTVPPPEPDFTPPIVENEDVPIEIPPDGFDFEGEFTADGVAYKIEWSEEYKTACKLFYKKNKTDAEKQECLRLFQTEADAGNVLALHDLGKLYGSSFFGEPDATLSVAYYRQALNGFLELEDFVERMKPYLQYRIGKMFAYGLGTEQDDAAAFAWFQKSALAGNKFAQHSTASCYCYGKGTAQNLSEAFRWYKAAAEKGMPYSVYALAQMYEKGEAVPPDEDKAHKYYSDALFGFLKIVSDGNVEDQLLYKLGRMFQRGLGTDIDIARAVRFYLQAADQHNQWAEYQLGKLYLFGADGIEPDREQAVEWLTRSAEDGNEYAEQMLRRMEDYQNRLLADTVFGLFVNVGRMIEDDYDRTGRVIQSRVDSKLRRAIRRKKMELGMKEDQSPTQRI